MYMWDFEQFCSTSNIFQVRRIVLWVERGRYRKECQYYSVRSTLWSDVRYCQILSDIVGYCQILPDIVIVHCSGMMGRDSVSSEQQLEDQQWVVESRRLVADFLKENLKSGNSWPGIFVTKIQMDKYLECKLVRFPWKFIQICSWAEKSREIGAGGGSQGKEQCE